MTRSGLSTRAESIFGLVHPQGRPTTGYKGIKMETLLNKPGLGTILHDIIEDGATLISQSKWGVEQLQVGQFTLRRNVVMVAIEDLMVEANLWVSLQSYGLPWD
jgi:hypothetical protein